MQKETILAETGGATSDFARTETEVVLTAI
jgi:hypothetical protein